MAVGYDHVVDRVQSRLEGLAVLLEHRQPDALAHSARRFATSWIADRTSVEPDLRAFLEHLEPVVVAGVFKALRPGATPASALAIARALWRLLDQPDDAPRRAELAALGTRLRQAVDQRDRRGATDAIAALDAWCHEHEWPLLYAIRRLADAA
jgi:hypothetical protein